MFRVWGYGARKKQAYAQVLPQTTFPETLCPEIRKTESTNTRIPEYEELGSERYVIQAPPQQPIGGLQNPDPVLLSFKLSKSNNFLK